MKLHAPSDDRAVLAEPPLAQAGELIERNREFSFTISGQPIDWVREVAVSEARARAVEYFRQGREPLPSLANYSLLVAGHQPELFHPGVWVKNFTLNGLARRHGLTPLNLVVDNDTVKSAALRLPALGADPADPAGARTLSLPFDHWSGEVVYEERRVADEEMFASLSERAASHLANWGTPTLLPEFWAEVMRQRDRTPLLGERFAAARRSVERRWGCHNLEVPLSRLCGGSRAFAWFACHLLGDLPAFHATYNDCLRAHRRANGIRSRNHPVPDLARDGDWLEAPFWAWRTGAQQRGRLFVRADANTLSFRSGGEEGPRLPFADGNDFEEAFQDLESTGYKIRTRALTTTLFARLCLADLFVHGIGGGKYDELTDAIIRAYFRIEPPAFLVLSATLRLPLPRFPAGPADVRRLGRAARDLHWNPQRHLPDGRPPALEELLAEKRIWIAAEPADATGRRERSHRLQAITDQLRRFVAGDEARAAEALARARREAAANAILGRRDYAFCLYPETLLRPFCTQFLHLT